jgi:predicted GH43/DUF377 family glycosyl hydrolase
MTPDAAGVQPVLKSHAGAQGVRVRRLPVHIYGNECLVVHLPLIPAAARVRCLLGRVGGLSDDQVAEALEQTLASYGGRHFDLPAAFEARYRQAAAMIGWEQDWPAPRRHLAGAYLTMEYAIESAALFNPSIVPHPDQSGLPAGAVRFLMSLRATGEGHISSIVFRTGVIDAAGNVSLDPPPKQVARARVSPDSHYLKPLLRQKLLEMGVSGMGGVDRVLAALGESFTLLELDRAVQAVPAGELSAPGDQQAVATLMWVARSNYRIRLPRGPDLTQLVIYPVTQEEIHGIEDLRLTRFTEDDGSVEYFGTYVAYDGQRVLPMLIRTRDFHEIEVHSINGAAALDKGMALFPRRIRGHYVMCSRIDGANLYIMYSDFVHFWETAQQLDGPSEVWNLFQVGNCGPPVETPKGWILLTHGVGPMRTYSIGALLLDLEDPTRILGRLRHPLLRADPSERDGYVPNVVYTCGSMIHGPTLYIPFALADRSTTMCAVEVEELLARLLESPP